MERFFLGNFEQKYNCAMFSIKQWEQFGGEKREIYGFLTLIIGFLFLVIFFGIKI